MTTRTPLRRDLADLKQKVYLLGEKCIEISDLHNSLLESYSENLENNLTDLSNQIKYECKELNDQCFLVLTLQQPLIKDLGFVIGSLQIVLLLEKITEQYLLTLTQLTGINILSNNLRDEVIRMSHNVQDVLRASLTLYLSSNISTSEDISKMHSQICISHDIVYKQILNELTKESGEKVQIEAQLLATVRAIEKVSDLAINIVEQVNYIIIGKIQAEKNQ